MTKVIEQLRKGLVFATWLGIGIAVATLAHGQDAAPPNPAPVAQRTPGPAEKLYTELNSVGLDPSRVYRIRDASLNQSAIHITFDNGTIAFTKDVAGRITGAFYEGEAELLLAPPTVTERASLTVFSGAAILEERFTTAYFRFNDDTFDQLEPFLRPADAAHEFVSQWDETAHNLAGTDALRLLMTFSRFLPSSPPGGSKDGPGADEEDDRFFHARIQGRKLGTLDIHFDSGAPEQIWVGQPRTVDSNVYFDTWTSFTPVVAARSMSTGVEAPSRQAAISVPAYKVRTEIKLPKAISAEAWLQVEVHQDGERALLFELSRFLQIKEVQADGQSIEFIHNPAVEGTQLARRGNDLVAVVLPRSLREGQHIELHFVYGGDVLSEAGSGLLYVGARGTWFPNRRYAMSSFDLEFRYPAGWTLVATGKKVQDSAGNEQERDNKAPSPNPAHEQESHWVSERPIPVAGFNLGRFHRVSAHAGKVEVETYAAVGVEQSFPKAEPEIVTPIQTFGLGTKPQAFVVPPPPPPSPARNAQAVADTSARAVDFFSRLYGPYPYGSLALTQNPGVLSQGWPSLVFLSSYSFLTDDEKSQIHMDPVERTLSNNVPAHETAHQWWGDLVGWESYHDQWISEALANYSALMLLETTNARDFQQVLDRYRRALLDKDRNGEAVMNAGPVTLGGRLSNSHSPEGYEAISYGRGTWLLHMLRCMMRDGTAKGAKVSAASPQPADELFVRALRKLREANEGKEITTHDLLAAFEQELPRPLWHEGKPSLDWFNDGWIKGTAIPRFELHNVKYTDSASGTLVAGAISQSDAPETLVTPVPIYAVAGNRTVLLGRVFVDEPETQFQVTAPRGTRKIVLDPNQTLLARR